KFVACLAVVVVLVAATAVHPAMVARLYVVRPGPLLAGYAGLVLLGAAFVGCGLFVSALTESQLVAAAATYGILFFFWMVTWNEAALSEGTLRLLLPLSLFDRLYPFARGAIDTRDGAYPGLVIPPRLSSPLLDLDRFPERARSLGVSSYGRAAIEYAGRRAVVLAAPEEELAGGIRRVVQGRSRRLVFTTGHGERPPGGGAEGYGRLAAALAAENYAAEVVSLVDGPVPDRADVLLVAGPRHDFLLPELDAVAGYLRAGGGVVMLLDPAPLPNLARLLASMGIRLGDDMIVDRERRVLGTDGLAAVVELFK